MSMKHDRDYWSTHVEAIKDQGVTTSAYAGQNNLSLAALYYWQRKLQSQLVAPQSAVAVATPEPQSKFVALRVNDTVAQVSPPSSCCILILAGGMHLEMSALPDPQWLAAVGRASQRAR
jgi:hypothetical protein